MDCAVLVMPKLPGGYEKATKLWGYHADRAAKSYHKAHGSANQKWHHMFTPDDRRKAAKMFADQGRAELEESFSKKANRENDGVNEYVVLPATSILKSAGDMERDKTKRYAKGNKAIRGRNGLPKDKLCTYCWDGVGLRLEFEELVSITQK